MKYMALMLIIYFGVSCTNEKTPVKSEDTTLHALIFLEGGFPGKEVEVSYNEKIVYTGIPVDFSKLSKAYSACIKMKVEKKSQGRLVIRVKSVAEKSFNVDWSKGSSLAAELKDDDIFILHPNPHGYK